MNLSEERWVVGLASVWLLLVVLLAPQVNGNTALHPDDRVEEVMAAASRVEDTQDEEAPGQTGAPRVLSLQRGCGRGLALPDPAGTGSIERPAVTVGYPLQEKPDLTVVNTRTVPGTFCRHAVVDIHSTIENIGTVAVVDSFYFDMWFDGENIGFARIEGLAAGASLELVLERFAWPGDTLSHVVTAMADTDHEIDEELEVNNIDLEYFAAEMCTTCTGVVLPFDTGWNWFSLNVDDADMSLDNVLASLDSSGLYIKNQTTFAEYVPAWNGWFGPLTDLNCQETYMIKMGGPDTLDFCGFPYDVSTPRELPSGWSWISYLPQVPMSVDDALGSLGASGENIKNQTTFAEYVPEWNGWFGTLVEMNPCDGFKMKMGVTDTLVYPDSVQVTSDRQPAHDEMGFPLRGPGDPTLDPHDYEVNACLIAEVRVNGVSCVWPGDRLEAFFRGECRGSVSSMMCPGGSHIFYLTLYGEVGVGEMLTFRYRDAKSGVFYLLDEGMEFRPDLTVGTSLRPFVFNARHEPGLEVKQGGTVLSLRNRPDPFAERTTLRFRTGVSGPVTVEIYDVCGEKICTLLDRYLVRDTYTLIWDGTTDSGRSAPGGVYFCRLTAGSASLTDKMVLMK